LSLNLLEPYRLAQITDGGLIAHLLVESWKFAFADRLALGDPAFVPSVEEVVALMCNKTHADELRTRMLMNMTFPTDHYADAVPLSAPPPQHGTTHLSAMDSAGNAVALTSTINLHFGSVWMSESTGILLNDEMDDFSVPGRPNAFHLPPSEANYAAPGKRPLSSMSPTLVFRDGRPLIAVGASGGSAIPTGTLQALVNMLDLSADPATAVSSPRIHSQLLPDQVDYEREVSSRVLSGLSQRGHKLVTSDSYNVVQAVARYQTGQGAPVFLAASDPRKAGEAAAY
jgi:gamma-glutamyltranspeptidase/glutathione hydrolase/leukotriene-C4 hydrolase